MHLKEVKRRKKGKTDATSRRKCSFEYSLSGQGVCQATFMDTYGITQRRLQTLQQKMKNGEAAPKDQRGKHTNRPRAVPSDVRESVQAHISSFPKQPSHYSRHKAESECLSPHLNTARMYSLYKERYPDTMVSRSYYEEVFRNDFKLRFGVPRSDTCKTCDRYFVQLVSTETEEERKKFELESSIHHRKADQAYRALKEDSDIAMNNPGTVVVLCVDMQQVLFCPTLSHSDVFYQRQLATYNFAIHDVGTGEVKMNLWNETVAKRGSAEITSCILLHVLEKYEPLNDGALRKLIVWSDRCVGENNNWKSLAMYRYLMLRGHFTEVHQKFLCSGHSFLPCDRDFALIEKRKKVSQVMVPSEWGKVIAEASPNKHFTVCQLEQSHFKDLSAVEETIHKNPQLQITQELWFKLCIDDPRGVSARQSHNVLRPWRRYEIVKIPKGGRVPRAPPNPTDLPLLYSEPLAITKEKKKDLMDMINYLPQQYREFYENIRAHD